MTTKTRTVTALELRPGHTITNSGRAVEGRVVAEVREESEDEQAFVQVLFTDGSTWELDGWSAEVMIRA